MSSGLLGTYICLSSALVVPPPPGAPHRAAGPWRNVAPATTPPGSMRPMPAQPHVAHGSKALMSASNIPLLPWLARGVIDPGGLARFTSPPLPGSRARGLRRLGRTRMTGRPDIQGALVSGQEGWEGFRRLVGVGGACVGYVYRRSTYVCASSLLVITPPAPSDNSEGHVVYATCFSLATLTRSPLTSSPLTDCYYGCKRSSEAPDRRRLRCVWSLSPVTASTNLIV